MKENAEAEAKKNFSFFHSSLLLLSFSESLSCIFHHPGILFIPLFNPLWMRNFLFLFKFVGRWEEEEFSSFNSFLTFSIWIVGWGRREKRQKRFEWKDLEGERMKNYLTKEEEKFKQGNNTWKIVEWNMKRGRKREKNWEKKGRREKENDENEWVGRITLPIILIQF